MRIIRNFTNINFLDPCVLTIGNFDGVHFGHQKIIDEVKKIAAEKKLKSAILSFFPHPIKFFKPDLAKNFLIFNHAQKLKFFKEYSLDYVFLPQFNQYLANLSAQDFIEKILVKKLKVKILIIGHDFIFGKNREGNLELLQKESKRFGFNIIKLEAYEKNNILCSSTKIRQFIKSGEVKNANEILNRNFFIEGIVSHGRKLAREIGFPTANLIPKNQLIFPKFGVYKVNVFIDSLQKKFTGIMNFGIKPTLENEESKPIYEIHIFNYDEKKFGSLYHKEIKVELINFIREEKKFESLEALKKQIADDINNCK